MPTPALPVRKRKELKMAKFNAENERIKRKYLEWEKEANGKSDSTITNIRDSLYIYEEFTQFKSFKKFSKNDAIAFKKYMFQKKSKRSQEPVSKTYLLHALKNLNNFFKWLHMLPGYKRSIDLRHIAYFSLSEKDIQIARAPKTKRFPTLEQIERVVRNMPFETDIQKRNRALVAFLILTGGRVTAVASLKLKHVFVDDMRIEQHPQEVKTKYSKKIVTFLLPVGDFLTNVFVEWVHFLKNEKHFDYNAPLFPNTKLSFNENDQFSRNELDFVVWQSTTSIREIVKQAFEAAGLDYYSPHSFRNTVVQLGYQLCKTPEDMKAWSLNLGHSGILTTLTNYGAIDECRQGEIIKRLGKNDDDSPLTMKSFKQLLKERQGQES